MQKNTCFFQYIFAFSPFEAISPLSANVFNIFVAWVFPTAFLRLSDMICALYGLFC